MVSTPSPRKNSSGSRIGSGPDTEPMMRWMEHSIPPASDGASPVSSMPAQGLSQKRTYPHFRHVLTRSSSPDAATQYGAFPLQLVFWIQPASPLDGGDPGPFVLIPFKSTSPRSDSWHRIGRNFACAYIRTYRWPASGWALRSRLLALSSASVAIFQPYLVFGQYQVSLTP